MIYSYIPAKNKLARRRYLKSFAVMYALAAFISLWKLAEDKKYAFPAFALFFAITMLLITTLRKPRFFAVMDEWLIYKGKINLKEAEIYPDFENLAVRIKWKKEKVLYFNSERDMKNFLSEVEKVKYS